MIADSITALLDSSLALNRAYVHVWVDVFTYPTTIADVRRAVTELVVLAHKVASLLAQSMRKEER